MTNKIKKPYTTAEFFNLIIDRVEDAGLLPDIIDYSLPTRDIYPIRTYEYFIKNRLDFGGNEGIYLNLWMEMRENGEWVKLDLGTIKTLGETREDMEKMGKLLADFMYEANKFANANLDDFTWSGYNVKLIPVDESKSYSSWDVSTKERAIQKKDEALAAGKYSKVVIFDYARRTEQEFAK